MMLGQSGDAISSPVGQQQAVALAVPLEDVADVAAASDIVEVVGTATHVTAEDYSLLGKVGGGGKPMRQVRFPGQGVPRWTPEEDQLLMDLVAELGVGSWKDIAPRLIHERSAEAVMQHYNILIGKRRKLGDKGEGDDEAGAAGAGSGASDEVDEAAKTSKAVAAEQRRREKLERDEERRVKAAQKDLERQLKERDRAEAHAAKDRARQEREQKAAAKALRASMPKKPRTSYLHFCIETRSTLLELHPGLPMVELAKVQGEKWQALPDEEKARYAGLAEEDVLRYQREMREGGWPLDGHKRDSTSGSGAASGAASGGGGGAAATAAAGSSKRQKKGAEPGLIAWALPKGWRVPEEKPTAEQLTFENERGDALVGKRILYNWAGVGWCLGIIEIRNEDRRFKLGADYVNFWVYYEVDVRDSLLPRAAACCCVLLRAAACGRVLLRAAACCCVLLRAAATRAHRLELGHSVPWLSPVCVPGLGHALWRRFAEEPVAARAAP